jgi:GT2 family glycosyltransferase
MSALQRHQRSPAQISVVIPTYQREQVLVDTIQYLADLSPAPAEILVIDQTLNHESGTQSKLEQFQREGLVRWIRMERPSITAAMNLGLRESRSDIVLFLDDDVVPGQSLVVAHMSAHSAGHHIVAGQVLQPGEEPIPESVKSRPFIFASSCQQMITELMAGNFSIKRELGLALGGFDENFVQVAYRFESEFAQRALSAGERIYFEPKASIRHLKVSSGGTRAFGHHLTTIRPSHAVGAYYFLLRSHNVSRRCLNLLRRPFRAVRTKHHATHPWWIPATLASEAMGFAWALFLYLRGPRLLTNSRTTHD